MEFAPSSPGGGDYQMLALNERAASSFGRLKERPFETPRTNDLDQARLSASINSRPMATAVGGGNAPAICR